MTGGAIYALSTLGAILVGGFLACVADGLVPNLPVADRLRPTLSCAGGLLLVAGFGATGFALALRG